MPKAQDAATWDNPPLMKAPEGVSPRVSTLSGQRDGSRASGPLPPEFTLSSTSDSITATITESNGATSFEIRVDSGPAISGLMVSDLTPEQIYSVQLRGTDANGTGAWSPAVNKATAAPYNPVGVLFTESFDDQPDWHSGLPENEKSNLPDDGVDYKQYEGVYTIPVGWNAVRQHPVWAPTTGHPDRHEALEISDATIAENPNRRRGDTGKSLVSWRDSCNYGDPVNNKNRWNSDGLLCKYLGGDYDEVYVEFYVNFSNECIQSFYDDKLGISKMVRIISHDDPLNYPWWDYFRGFTIYNKPIALWDFKGGTAYGIQNAVSIYRYNDGETPNPDLNDTIKGNPSSFNRGDTTFGYTPAISAGTTGQGLGGTTPQLINRKTGGIIDHFPVMMDELFGDETHWTKMGFYVKMCSAPGASDGEWMQFVDDQRVMHIYDIMWIPPHAPMKKWNMVYFSGNDNFTKYDDSERHEEWYAFDDITIRDSLPEHLRED